MYTLFMEVYTAVSLNLKLVIICCLQFVDVTGYVYFMKHVCHFRLV